MIHDVHVPVLCIDGPSGVGKGTLSRWLCAELGWNLLDSGALYRVLAWLIVRDYGECEHYPASCYKMGVDLSQRVSFDIIDSRVILDGEEVSAQLRPEKIGAAASSIASLPEVRKVLLREQRAFRVAPGLVADGRDMGTVVFPDAGLKLFLNADASSRARRRYDQLNEMGFDANLERLEQEMSRRDERDATRAVSPMRAADDAVVVDTTHMNIREIRDLTLKILSSSRLFRDYQ